MYLIFLSFLLNVTPSRTMHLASNHQDYPIHGNFTREEQFFNTMHCTSRFMYPFLKTHHISKERTQHLKI